MMYSGYSILVLVPVCHAILFYFFFSLNKVTDKLPFGWSLKRCRQDLVFLHNASDDGELGAHPAGFSFFESSSKVFVPLNIASEYFPSVTQQNEPANPKQNPICSFLYLLFLEIILFFSAQGQWKDVKG